MNTNIVNKTVSTSAILLVESKSREFITIINHGSYTVWLANSSAAAVVNGAAAFPLASGTMIEKSTSQNSWYGICDTGESSKIAILEELPR